MKQFAEHERKYLKTTKTETLNFHGLPKVHKSVLLTNAIGFETKTSF